MDPNRVEVGMSVVLPMGRTVEVVSLTDVRRVDGVWTEVSAAESEAPNVEPGIIDSEGLAWACRVLASPAELTQ